MAARDPSPTLEGVYLRNGEEATLVLHATQVGGLHMVRHRLDQRGRDGIKPGNVYVWEEQTQRGLSETCLERWTDGMRWGPSRGGADGFLKYNQKLEDGESGPPLIKRTYSALMRVGGVEAPRKCYIVAYSSTCAQVDARLLGVEALAWLPRQVPPGWYQPWRAPRRRGKKIPQPKAKDTGLSASPVAVLATTSAPRDVHLSLRSAAYPRHPHANAHYAQVPERRPYRVTSASSSSEASAASVAPPPDTSALPMYTNVAPPVAAPQPVHPGPRPFPPIGDQDRTLLPRSGDAALADKGEGMSTACTRGASSQSLEDFMDSSRSSCYGHYPTWGTSYQNAAGWPQHAYHLEPYGAQQGRSQMHSYGLAAMQASLDMPEAPFCAPQADHRDHLGVAPAYRTTPARYTPYGAPEEYPRLSSLPNAEYYPWKIDTPGHCCSWPAGAAYADHPNHYPHTADGYDEWKSTHYPGESHFAFTGSASDYTHITTN